MGQDVSKSITPPPLSLQDCLINGQIDIIRYIYYRSKIDDMIKIDEVLVGINKKRKLNDFNESKRPRKK